MGNVVHPTGFEPVTSAFGGIELRARHGLLFYVNLPQYTVFTSFSFQ